MFCRFWWLKKLLFLVGLSDWNLHLYELFHNPQLHCVIVDFSAELFPAFQGNSRNFLLIREINKIMTQLRIRFHVLAFMHVWHSRFSLASLHRFLIIKPFSRGGGAGGWGGGGFPNKNHTKPSREHRCWAWEFQSSVRSCFFTAGASIDAWLHHLEQLPTSRCSTASWGSLSSKHWQNTFVWLLNKSHSLEWSLTDDELETAWCITAHPKSSTENNHGHGERWREVLEIRIKYCSENIPYDPKRYEAHCFCINTVGLQNRKHRGLTHLDEWSGVCPFRNTWDSSPSRCHATGTGRLSSRIPLIVILMSFQEKEGGQKK